MALQIDINGTIVPAGGFYQMAEWIIYTADPGYPTEIVTITNTGSNAFTVTGVVKASWARNIDVSGFQLPLVLNPAQSATGVLRVTRRGGLDEGTFVPGTPFGRTTFATTTGSYNIDHAAKMRRDTATTGYVFPSTGDFANFWVVDAWSLAAGTISESNPLGFAYASLQNSGHLVWAQLNVSRSLDAGHKAILLWRPWGSTSEIYTNDGNKIQFDEYIQSKEFGQSSGYNMGWQYWEDALNYINSYPDVNLYIYLGTMQTDTHFTDLILASGHLDFLERTLRSLDHCLRRYNLNLCFDSPGNEDFASTGNPLITVGEPRYEFYRLCKNLISRRGGRIYYEPRPNSGSIQWYAASGWNHVMTDTLYIRNNPDWYVDANDSAYDSQLGTIMRWMTNGVAASTPYRIADTLIRNQQSLLGLGNGWYNTTGTMLSLYNATRDLLYYCQGSGIGGEG